MSIHAGGTLKSAKSLRSTEIIDWDHTDVLCRAHELAEGTNDPIEIAGRCFEWVRDKIRHTWDYQLKRVTCIASEVLWEGIGYCYAKSHLLAALLRAGSIPAGLCYQRLSRDGNGPPYCLHGLNALFLPGIGWYRVDARGDRAGINTQFSPPREQLAFSIVLEGEADLPEVWTDPLPVVIEALSAHETSEELYENLPDLYLWKPWRTA